MSIITVEESQTTLPELLAKLTPGEAVVITRDGKPVARLTPELPMGVPVFGRCKGMLTILSDDNRYLDDFEGYL